MTALEELQLRAAELNINFNLTEKREEQLTKYNNAIKVLTDELATIDELALTASLDKHKSDQRTAADMLDSYNEDIMDLFTRGYNTYRYTERWWNWQFYVDWRNADKLNYTENTTATIKGWRNQLNIAEDSTKTLQKRLERAEKLKISITEFQTEIQNIDAYLFVQLQSLIQKTEKPQPTTRQSSSYTKPTPRNPDKRTTRVIKDTRINNSPTYIDNTVIHNHGDDYYRQQKEYSRRDSY